MMFLFQEAFFVVISLTLNFKWLLRLICLIFLATSAQIILLASQLSVFFQRDASKSSFFFAYGLYYYIKDALPFGKIASLLFLSWTMKVWSIDNCNDGKHFLKHVCGLVQKYESNCKQMM